MSSHRGVLIIRRPTECVSCDVTEVLANPVTVTVLQYICVQINTLYTLNLHNVIC